MALSSNSLRTFVFSRVKREKLNEECVLVDDVKGPGDLSGIFCGQLVDVDPWSRGGPVA